MFYFTQWKENVKTLGSTVILGDAMDFFQEFNVGELFSDSFLKYVCMYVHSSICFFFIGG